MKRKTKIKTIWATAQPKFISHLPLGFALHTLEEGDFFWKTLKTLWEGVLMRNKKKLIIGTISLVAIISAFIVVIFLTAPNFILSMITPDINLEDENFNGIHLNQNITEFNKADISVDIDNPNFYNLSNGVRLITDENGDINNIAITHDTNQTVKTSRGFTV